MTKNQGEYFKDLRKKHRLTQEAVMNKLNELSESTFGDLKNNAGEFPYPEIELYTYRNWEYGKSKPKMWQLVLLAELYNIDPKELIHEFYPIISKNEILDRKFKLLREVFDWDGFYFACALFRKSNMSGIAICGTYAFQFFSILMNADSILFPADEIIVFQDYHKNRLLFSESNITSVEFLNDSNGVFVYRVKTTDTFFPVDSRHPDTDLQEIQFIFM